MIAVTAEFLGHKYLIASDFTNYDHAEACATEWKTRYPMARFYLADREAHIEGCKHVGDFVKAVQECRNKAGEYGRD